MDKEKLIKLAEELHQEAFDANGYFLIMEQYRKFHKEYYEEMRLSSAFYQTVYSSLMKSCFMEIAKLYDASSDTVTIGSLLKECQKNLSVFPEYREMMTIESDGNKITFPVPYQHRLKPEEECFFKEQVASQRKLFEVFNVPSPDKEPVQVDLTFPQFLELYQKRFCSLSKKRENIRQHRNKLYAHNDEKQLMDLEDVIKSNPVLYSDIRELIDFALDCTGLILGVLTDVCRARNYSNIKDWEGTLMLVRLGLKYQDYDLKEQEKAFAEELKLISRGETNG